MLVTPLTEREKRSTWKDGGNDTLEIQLKTAFIEIDGQPIMMMMLIHASDPLTSGQWHTSFINSRT